MPLSFDGQREQARIIISYSDINEQLGCGGIRLVWLRRTTGIIIVSPTLRIRIVKCPGSGRSTNWIISAWPSFAINYAVF